MLSRQCSTLQTSPPASTQTVTAAPTKKSKENSPEGDYLDNSCHSVDSCLQSLIIDPVLQSLPQYRNKTKHDDPIGASSAAATPAAMTTSAVSSEIDLSAMLMGTAPDKTLSSASTNRNASTTKSPLLFSMSEQASDVSFGLDSDTKNILSISSPAPHHQDAKSRPVNKIIVGSSPYPAKVSDSNRNRQVNGTRPRSQTATAAKKFVKVQKMQNETTTQFGATGGLDDTLLGELEDVDDSAQLLQTSYKARLFRFYQHYNPKRLPFVEGTLRHYEGREAAMFRHLCCKYGPEPARDIPLRCMPVSTESCPAGALTKSKSSGYRAVSSNKTSRVQTRHRSATYSGSAYTAKASAQNEEGGTPETPTAIISELTSRVAELESRNEALSRELLEKTGHEDPDGMLCVICLTNRRDAVAEPCGHVAVCNVCVEEYHKTRKEQEAEWKRKTPWWRRAQIMLIHAPSPNRNEGVGWDALCHCIVCRKKVKKYRRLFIA